MSHSDTQTYIANQTAIDIGRSTIGNVLNEKEKWQRIVNDENS